MLGREPWAIGTDHHRGSAHGRDRSHHAGAEIAVRLDREDNTEERRNSLEYWMMMIRRRPQGDRTNSGRLRGGYDALDEPGLQACGTVGTEHRRQPRLGETGQWRFGQNRDRHWVRIAVEHSHRIVPDAPDLRRENTRIAATT